MRILILSLFILPFFFIPEISFAQLVPCNGPDCGTCEFVQLGNNILRWLISVMAVICALVIVFAGFKMVVSAGNSGEITKAKEMMANTLIGFIILLAAWLIVDTVMRMFVNQSVVGPWHTIQCIRATAPVGTPAGTGTVTATTTTAICTDDSALMAQYRGSPIGLVDPALQTLISCYLGDSNVAAATDSGQLFTVDRSRPRCSLTNGNPICGACSHSNNSCHYGRGSGAGARAVDFNAGSGFTEAQLYSRLQARRTTCGGNLLNEGSHTHISLSSC